MGRVHKLLIKSCLKGVATGWIILAIILAINLFGLREFTFGSSHGILAIFLLAVGFAITFGNAAMGYAIMRLPKTAENMPPDE